MREKAVLQIMLLTSSVAFKPSNIGRFPDFTAARTLLASKDSKVNTFAVEQAAAVCERTTSLLEFVLLDECVYAAFADAANARWGRSRPK